jgi:hypothetical protein
MNILHLTFHVGCANDIEYIFQKLGHKVTTQFLKNKIQYNITENIAQSLWSQNKNFYNSFDMIITSDTTALSFPFLLNQTELIPFLIILVCNRFNYAMENENNFHKLLNTINNKIIIIPYTDFESIWCARYNIPIYKNKIYPVGKTLNNFKIDLSLDFGNYNRQFQRRNDDESIFIQTYGNHVNFMNLSKFLFENDLSVVYGGYENVNELSKFGCIIVLPDAFSKYFVFESLQNDLVIFLPSQQFLLDLVTRPGYFFNIEGSSGRLDKIFVNLCEWYRFKNSRIYFDSFEDLIQKLKNFDKLQKNKIQKYCKLYSKQIEDEILMKWNHILDEIELLKII